MHCVLDVCGIRQILCFVVDYITWRCAKLLVDVFSSNPELRKIIRELDAKKSIIYLHSIVSNDTLIFEVIIFNNGRINVYSF